MKKSGIISIIIASVLVVIGVTLGFIFGLKKDKTKNDLYITIEAEDKIYDGEALMVNVLSSQDTTFEIFYKSHDSNDEEYSAVAPIKVGNYDIKVVATRENKNLTEETQVSILPKELYIDGLDINSKVYDGNKEIEFDNELLLNGVVKDDDVILNYDDLVISFDNAEVEDNKNVSISGLLIEGEDIGNYELKIPSIRADILPREVIVEGISVKDKIFDGTTEAEIEGNIALNGLLESETKVSFAGELKANFEYSEVGENIKIIFSGLSLTGDNAKNYILIYPEIYANITEKPHYIVNYSVNNEEYGYIEGDLTQEIEQGENCSTVTAIANEGFKFVKWSDGILDSERTDRKVNRNISVQAIFEKEKIDVNTFDFENSFNDVIVDSSSRIDENGYIQVTLEDNDENVTILNETLTLLPSQKWTIESKFKITYLQGEKYYFTFLGVLEGNDVKDIYALQVSQKALRIYAGGKDNEYILQNDLSFDKEYIFSLSCDGLNALVLNITDAFTQEKIVENQIIEYDGDKVVNANVIGNSIYLGGNQCSEGTIYYLHINNVYQGPENPGGEKFTLTYKVNNEEYGYIEGNSIQIVKKGLNGETVTAKANAGYRFVKWDDEKMSAQRLDENITENKIITAIFEPVSSVESFDFINEVSDIKIENPMSVDENGIIQVSMNDTQSDVTTLSGKLVLKTNEIWTMETKFKMTELKDGDWYFTFLGTYVAGTAEEVFALQINTTTFRIYMGTNNGFDFYPLDKTLELNKEYTLTLSCDGKQNLTLNIVDSKEVTVIENQVINFTSSEYVSNCDVIGNSFYHTGETVINQGSAGEIYYLHIKKD